MAKMTCMSVSNIGLFNHRTMYDVSQSNGSTVSTYSQYPLCCPHNPTDICCCFL